MKRKNFEINDTIGTLDLFDICIDINRTTKEIYSIFEKEKNTPGIILTNKNKYIGLLSRKKFYEVMSKPFSLELFLKRSIDTLYQEVQNFEELILHQDTLISSAASIALQRDNGNIYDPIVVACDDYHYKVLDIDQLLIAQSIIHKKTLEQLQKNVIYIKNLLNNSGQGFLTIKNDLYVEAQYSNECKNIFGFDIENHFFPKLIYPNDERQQHFLTKILIKIIEEKEKKQLNKYLPLLPEEISINSKNISIEYKRIKYHSDEETKKYKLMVILTDITEKRKLENQIAIERNQLNMVVQVIKNYDNFIECINDYKNFYLKDLQKILNSDIYLDEIINEVFRKIHTFKGNFQQIEMVNVVDFLHNIEEELLLIQTKNKIMNIEEFKSFLLNIDFSEKLNQDLFFINHILGEKFITDLKSIKLKPEEINELEKEIIKLPQNEITKRILEKINHFKYKNLKEELIPYFQYTYKLAERKGKLIKNIEIEGDDIFICYDNYKSLIKSLIHIFRNSIDHGIENPEDRIKKGKNEYGIIKCKLKNYDNHFSIIISDDGSGIDIEKIKEIIIKKHKIPLSEINKLNDNDILNTIFNSCFSTKEEISEISGRGIGLSSVKSEVEKLNGSIIVNTIKDVGTEFTLTLPKNILSKKIDDSLFILKKIIDYCYIFFKDILPSNDFKDINIEEYNEERLALKTFSSFIDIKTNSEIKIIISIDFNLTKYLLNFFMQNVIINQYEEHKYLEDTVSETLNTILGNTTQSFFENGYNIDFSAPVIMTSDEAIFKYPPTQKWKYTLNTNKGDIILYSIK